MAKVLYSQAGCPLAMSKTEKKKKLRSSHMNMLFKDMDTNIK